MMLTKFYYQLPKYEKIKTLKKEQEEIYYLFGVFDGNYFRMVVNEEFQKNIALDYMQNGFLFDPYLEISSKYKFNHLYALNKKNYNGLIELYKMTLAKIKSELDKSINQLEELEKGNNNEKS